MIFQERDAASRSLAPSASSVTTVDSVRCFLRIFESCSDLITLFKIALRLMDNEGKKLARRARWTRSGLRVFYNVCERYYLVWRQPGLATSRPENLAKSLSAEALRRVNSAGSGRSLRGVRRLFMTFFLEAGCRRSVSLCTLDRGKSRRFVYMASPW